MVVARKKYDLTVDDAARRLGVHPETVKRWCRNGTIDAAKNVSGHWRLNKTDVDDVQVGVVIE